MYDDSIASANYSNVNPHWYDEPPYESDADDFLMSGIGAAEIIQVQAGFVKSYFFVHI